MTNIDIINKLRQLDLSKYPYEDVKDLISHLSHMFVRMSISGRLLIERLRPGNGFVKRSEVGYKLWSVEDQPNRATIPGRSIFYGTIAHPRENATNRRYIALCESSTLLNQGLKASGREHYTLSIWGINRPLKVEFIVNDKAFENRNNVILQDAKDYYNANMSFVEKPLGMDLYKDFVVDQSSPSETLEAATVCCCIDVGDEECVRIGG